MQTVGVHLPGGVSLEQEWCHRAWLRPVTGWEEEFLLDEGRHMSVAARVTQLLARCLVRLGPVEPVGVEQVRQLTVGDREALLLHIRRITLGERVSCSLSCPNCAKKMDLDLLIGELLLSPYPHRKTIHTADISDSDNSYRVTFRVPNGEDQEVIADSVSHSVDAAAELILRRCISQVDSIDAEDLTDLPPVVLRDLPGKMAALDPQAELLLDLICPECASGFEVPFDAGDYVCRELLLQEKEFYREVHALSWHYHWSEDAVLGLSRRKRHIYLELLSDELTRGGRTA
jgi:hypothetical protein